MECKHYKYPISEEIVQKVYNNLRAIDAQKGIVVSTSNFQSDAIEYVKVHSIALIQMTEAENIFHTRCHYSIVVNYPYVAKSGEQSHIGVMIGQGKDGVGVTCSYLSALLDVLEKFLLSSE